MKKYCYKITWINLISSPYPESIFRRMFANAPNECGVYVGRTNEEILYVGSSKDLKNRLLTNTTLKNLHKELLDKLIISYGVTDDYLDIERWIIDNTMPLHNSIPKWRGRQNIDDAKKNMTDLINYIDRYKYTK